MSKHWKSAIVSIIIFTGVMPATQAHSPGAHVHGLSTLTIAIEAGAVEIELTSPAIDLVGFEHTARTEQERERVKAAASRLAQPETLFSLSEAGCQHLETTIDLADIIHDDKLIEGQAHSHHDHSHTDIVANYKYHCQDPTLLSSMTVALFAVFPGIEKIDVVWIKATQQGAATLSANHRTIKFS
jgi:hypothetical protein